ncbi:MAG TPA: selenocysteine-specific translation elongation factor [Anaerolineaceae bacterium]|nr:selenocysteine-specific translation elongation factor [Anaerolineaceae bacterium]
MYVIGTAGHVDHGKSTLIAALTGTHPDRLKEEREREMTIELGFAWLTLPEVGTTGIVDVPGHRDFIENMLAGVGGIDAAIFVVAADESVMPQTREHLAILDLLQIPGGVIALTKIDLTPDPEWLDLVELDVHQAVRGTVMADAPICRVSARNGTGLVELKQALANCLSSRLPRLDLGRPRLPIDRVFTMPGFGTIVTGTLTDGVLHLGDEVEILPSGKRGRIRTLQTHRQKQQSAPPGGRTAVNITGIEVEEIQRGDVLALPGHYRPTQRLDLQFRLLPDAAGPLTHSAEVKFFVGASEVVARTRLLGCDVLNPGETGWIQLELRTPIVTVRGDHYILRRPSPSETLGGGVVVDAQPVGRHRRFDPVILERLATLLHGAPADLLLRSVLRLDVCTLAQAAANAHLAPETAVAAFDQLQCTGEIIKLDGDGVTALLIARSRWQALTDQALAELAAYHRSHPLRTGSPREALKSRLKLEQRTYQALLKQWLDSGQIIESRNLLALAEFRVQLTSGQQEQMRALLARFAAVPYTPPSVKECITELGEDLYQVAVAQSYLLPVSAEVVFRPVDVAAMHQWVDDHLAAHGILAVTEFRDAFNTSRKYALAFLEYLDALGVTVRDGDFRKQRT